MHIFLKMKRIAAFPFDIVPLGVEDNTVRIHDAGAFVMIDEGLLPIANTRFILLEDPAQQIQLPPAPPASESEAAIMWRPSDRPAAEVDRIPLNSEGEKEVAAAYGIWLGASLLHTVLADAKNDRRDMPELVERDDDEVDPKKSTSK